MASRIVNCYIGPREGDDRVLFKQVAGGGFDIDLDGYAIIPMEEYEALLARQSQPETEEG